MREVVVEFVATVLLLAGAWSFLRLVARAVNRVWPIRLRRGWWSGRYLIRDPRLEIGHDVSRKIGKAFAHLSETDRIKVQAFTYWWVQEARKNILTTIDATIFESGLDQPALAKSPAFNTIAKETSSAIARMNATIDAQQLQTANDPEVRAL